MVAPETCLACLLDWLLPFLVLDEAWELSQGSRLLVGSVLRRSFLSVAKWGRDEVARRCRLLVASQFQLCPLFPSLGGCERCRGSAAELSPARLSVDQLGTVGMPAYWIELRRQAWVAFGLRAWLTSDASAG